jgi:RNA polymerase sigma factor (sigma-70 family)
MRSDTVLAERFADGDESAFVVLFERHRASVLAVCMGVLGSRHDAEDAAQDAFASLAVALRKAPPTELRPWLVRVARNAAIDLARRRRTRAVADCAVPEDGGLATDRVLVSQGLKAELESVIAGIKELPESQRTALLMRELAGHSYAEIAGLLAIDEVAVRGLIARARIGLRAHRDASERAPRAGVRALRGLAPLSGGGFGGGGALFGGLAAKGAVLGTAATQATAACAVSVCAVGGLVLLSPPGHAHQHPAGVHRAAPPAGHATAHVGRAAAPVGHAAAPVGHAAAPVGHLAAPVGRAAAPVGRTAGAAGATPRPAGSARRGQGSSAADGGSAARGPAGFAVRSSSAHNGRAGSTPSVTVLGRFPPPAGSAPSASSTGAGSATQAEPSTAPSRTATPGDRSGPTAPPGDSTPGAGQPAASVGGDPLAPASTTSTGGAQALEFVGSWNVTS